MKSGKAFICWLSMACMVNADVWVTAPDGYYILKLDDNGAPITTPAVGITGHVIMGVPPDPTDPEDPPPPTEDEWGLAAASEAEAKKVNEPEMAGTLEDAYLEIGKLVQAGKISEKQLKGILDISFDVATVSAKNDWIPWKESTDERYNGVDFNNAEKAGQGLIDIGIGAGRTRIVARVGEKAFSWLRFLTCILEILGD